MGYRCDHGRSHPFTCLRDSYVRRRFQELELSKFDGAIMLTWKTKSLFVMIGTEGTCNNYCALQILAKNKRKCWRSYLDCKTSVGNVDALRAHKVRQNRRYGSTILSHTNSTVDYGKFDTKSGFKFK